MLDPATMVLLGRLKILAKQAGMNIDLVRMNADKRYAERVLEELGHASDDPELVLVVIKLMNRYGMFGAPIDTSKAEKGAAGHR
jgi:hypothetical protein